MQSPQALPVSALALPSGLHEEMSCHRTSGLSVLFTVT